MFKARYYPNGNFFNAKIGSNPSYVWRSLLSTQKLIRDGARIRIGSGKQTSIWYDPWLPDKKNPLIESEIIPHLALDTVDSLRISENGDWDIDLVKDLFNERDQKLIFSVPLVSLKGMMNGCGEKRGMKNILLKVGIKLK